MVNPYLEKSVATTKKLQVIITRMVEYEKDRQDYVDSADYPAEKLAQFMDEQENPYTEETQLLSMVNDLLYRLMDYQRNKEKWYDEEDIEQKTVMKLKEVVTGNACPF
jgi:hypothetical protein